MPGARNDGPARREPRAPVGRPAHRRQGPARRGRRRRRRGRSPAGRPSAHAGDRLVDGRSHHRSRRQRRRGRSPPHPPTGAGTADARVVPRGRRAVVDEPARGVELFADRGVDARMPARRHRHPPTSFDHRRSRPTIRVRRRPRRGRGHRPRRRAWSVRRSRPIAMPTSTWPVVARRLVEIYGAVGLGARRGEQSK